MCLSKRKQSKRTKFGFLRSNKKNPGKIKKRNQTKLQDCDKILMRVRYLELYHICYDELKNYPCILEL